MAGDTPPPVRGPDDLAGRFDVSRETLEALCIYVETLEKWQRTINLVAPGTLAEVWQRHIADSLQLVGLSDEWPVPASPMPRRWVDVGSGAGFPGLVCAIALAGRDGTGGPAWRMTLIESDQRKCAFLREVMRATGLGSRFGPTMAVDIFAERIEKAATRVNLHAADIVSARALAPLSALLELTFPFHGVATRGLYMKGKEADSEVARARRQWRFACRVVHSVTDRQSSILCVTSLQPAQEGSSS